MKNKITLSQFFEALTDSIGYIEDDLEDESFEEVPAYVSVALNEFEQIKDKILTLQAIEQA